MSSLVAMHDEKRCKRNSENKVRAKVIVCFLEHDSDKIKRKNSKHDNRKSIADGGNEKLADSKLKPSTKTKEDSSSQTSKNSASTSKVLLKGECMRHQSLSKNQKKRS